MSVKLIPQDPKMREMAVEVVKNARRQTYTPEQLCELQKIIETQYYYWWIMDLKKEELAVDLFTEDFSYYCFGPQTVTAYEQARRSKFVNEDLATSHMGHQPLIWLISDTEARGVFQYEDHHVRVTDKSIVRGWQWYIDDFVKCPDGAWRIKAMRLAYSKLDGSFGNTDAPADWQPKEWEI